MWPLSAFSRSYFTRSGASGPKPNSTEPQRGAALEKFTRYRKAKVAVTGSCTVSVTFSSGLSDSLGLSITLPAPTSPRTLKVIPSLLAFTCMVSPNSFKSRQMRRNSAEGSLATTLYCCSGISMCSLSICINFKSKSAIRSSSPPSHWKLTLSEPLCHRTFSESLGLHIFKILASESTFIPREVGRSHLNSAKADSRSSSETSATWELSMDWTCIPFSLQSKFTSLHNSLMESTTFFNKTDCWRCASSAMAARVCKDYQHTR
mmetsp:Transcript_143825/g.365062  ORF Transcript_143825/g.365062 Transcript_143825/m.365062 type:complete len:262 (-) Transcript_143825:57-842(-)